LGETRVDLHHLLEDLRAAYPGALEETILTEVAANSLNFDTTAAGGNVQLNDFVFVGQAGFAARATSFTEFTRQL
jgi:hypothetical protein